MLTARDVMNRSLLFARSGWGLSELASFLSAHAIGGAPVVDERGRICGMVSVTDLARTKSVERAVVGDVPELLERASEGGLGPSDLQGMLVEVAPGARVEDIMTPCVFSVPEEVTIAEVAEQMTRGRIHRVLVMKGSTPVGIISSLDLARVVRDMAEPAPQLAED